MKAGLLAAGLALVMAAWYALSCWRWPLAHCFCCSGKGTHARKDGKVFRTCWWCRRIPGRRWRIGRRVWNWFHRHARG